MHMLKNFPMQSLIPSNLHSAMREDTILKRKRIPLFPEQQNGSCPIIRCSEVLQLHLKLWRTLNCAIGMKSILQRLTQSRESFMPIRRADFRRKSGFLFSRMNISMPDCSTRNGAMGVTSFCGTSPATTSSTTGCTKWRSAECRPDGLLYDETLHNKSAESIYDLIVKEIRKYKKRNTFRGFGRGDMFNGNRPHFTGRENGVSLDELLKNALREGLDYHQEHNRGFLPAGLVQEIRALAMPAIPWDAALAKWFDVQFPPLEKHRTYARPSRRAGCHAGNSKTGIRVLRAGSGEPGPSVWSVDTSGSMSAKQIGMALGSIASYAAAKDVPFVRIIFCDAKATDAGYLAPEDIAGRVKVTGRGGTILQPGVDCLEQANDFPKDGPILIITDGEIENDLKVRREHAFLLPRGNRLPFRTRGEVFYFRE